VADNPEDKIPENLETGSTGDQKSTSVELVPTDPENLFPPIVSTVQGIAATKPRGLGGGVTADLMAGVVMQISYDLNETKSELRTTREDLDTARNDLSKSQIRAAVLGERVSDSNWQRHLQNLAITGGVILLGVAFELNKNDLSTLSILVGVLGLALIFAGWWRRSSEPKP